MKNFPSCKKAWNPCFSFTPVQTTLLGLFTLSTRESRILLADGHIMKQFKRLSFAIILSLSALLLLTSLPGAALAQSTTSAPCPYSCKTLGIKKKKCKDWREGDTCYVQDLRKNQGQRRAARSGNGITSRPCPYSCRSQGIPKKRCKDWKEGNTCYVQDLR